ncbi:MAG: cache domain-containing protein, partial [Lachnospiraceae bacterium]|nr:cache domain-containing protein [Lachnospiraceae bacterium]
MKAIITKTKVCIYILLAVLTAAFAFLSFSLYVHDLETRLIPQVERAIIQASRLLPQLEENEDALREISYNLERSRQRILRANEGISDDQIGDEENVETVIRATISWMNQITMLRVGRRGHVIVVSQDDLSILAHSDERFIGERLHLVGGSLDPEDIPDLKELGGKIRRKDLPEEFYLFFPDSFFGRDPESERFYAAVDAGAYGSVFAYEDTYVICGVTLVETLEFVIVRCFFSTLFFFAIAWVFVRYIGFALGWHKEEPKAFRGKLVSYAAMAVIVFFCAIWYYQTMMDVTGDIATMNDHAEAAAQTLNTYQQYREDLSSWLDTQYLDQCRLAADLVLEKGKENLTREDMAKFAKGLGVEYIYVFDQKGKVLVTNSPYDHFELSKNEGDPSYAFRPLLDGKEYVIQGVREDDFGEKKQYIGVSIRDEKDLCDGFVQIVINPLLRERLLDPINVQTVLDNLVIGIPEYALAIDKATMQIVATTGLGFQKSSIEDLGIEVEEIKGDYDGILTMDGKTYYAGVSESESLYLMPLVRSTDNSNALSISCIMGLFGIAAYFLIVLFALPGYGKAASAGEAEESETAEPAADDDNKKDKKRNLWSRLFKAKKKFGFDSRWRKQSAIPLDEQTPEMRTGGIIYRLLLIFSTAFLLFEISLIYMGKTKGVSLDGFSYVLEGNWEKGLNLFSFSYCLFLLCVLYVFQELLNQVLYRIAKVSDLKHETILLLLRSALKYFCALVFLY